MVLGSNSLPLWQAAKSVYSAQNKITSVLMSDSVRAAKHQSALLRLTGLGAFTPERMRLELKRFSYRQVGDALNASTKLSGFLSSLDQAPRALQAQVAALQRSGLLGAIEDAPHDRILELLTESSVAESPRLPYGAGKTDLNDEQQLVAALGNRSGQVSLSGTAKTLLLTVLIVIATLYTEIAKWQDFRESLCDINARVAAIPGTKPARDAMNSFVCGVPGALRSEMRLVVRKNVRLREEPRMTSSVIMELPIYSVLAVLDSEDRTWMQVAYTHGDVEIVGWVSRSMVRSVPGR